MLSTLAKSFFAKSPVLGYPVLALVLFFLAFAAITWRALRADRAELDRLAALPFPELSEEPQTDDAKETCHG